MRCSACRIDHPDGIRYCTKCGGPLAGTCPACGAAGDAEARFCGQCGTALGSSRTTAEREPTPEAERRQLTVLFCDLVGSTVLSERLDPEDLREVVRQYQAACGEVVERFGGHVAQYLGDGLLVYFGYPEAHEDDAKRAVHAGLGIVDAMGRLNERLERERSLRVAVRLGIHTGRVVAGEVGTGKRREQLAIGRTPNVAARLQGLAEPDQVLLSHATHQLIQGYFDCQELGEQNLKGVSQPMAVYRAVREIGLRTRLAVAEKRGLTPFVGRNVELGLLRERYGRVREGRGQAVLITGEAGIGKSRLLRAFREELAVQAGERPPWLFCSCSPYDQTSAFHPLIKLLEKLFRFRREDSSAQKLSKMKNWLRPFRSPLPETVRLLSPLLSLGATDEAPQGNEPPSRRISSELQKSKTLELILTLLMEMGDEQPVVLEMEDLHWVDPSSLEFLELLVRQGPTARIFTLLTSRPSFQPPWGRRSHLTQLTLDRLANDQVEAMVQTMVGEPLPDVILGQIVERSDGTPLFVEELTKVVLTSDLASAAIPATVQDSLMARLDRLGTAKDVAQLASILGRDFTYEMLAAISQLPEARLQEELARLVETELLYQRGVPPFATFAFKHALIRDTAYGSLLKAARQRCHGKVADVLERSFPETLETQPELLAHHYTEAGLLEAAVVHWLEAGRRDQRRGTYREASAHYKRGLALIERTPESPQRKLTELKQWLGLSYSLGAAEGWAAPEVGEALGHVQRLATKGVESREEAFLLEHGLWAATHFQPDLQKALEHGQHMAELAQSDDEKHLTESCLGITRYWLGELEEARAHLETALAHKNGNPACSYLSAVLGSLGYLDQALTRSEQAITLAHGDIGYLHSEALLFGVAASLTRGELKAAWEKLRELLTVYQEEDSYIRRLGEVWEQCILAVFDSRPTGSSPGLAGTDAAHKIERIWNAYNRVVSTGSKISLTGTLVGLIDVCLKLGRIEDGRRALKEALVAIADAGERVVEGALYQRRGELVLAASLDAKDDLPSRQREAESAFRQALEIARRQSNRLVELQTTVSLSRLWRSQGKRAEARHLLSEVYGWFTEGFDTAPLNEAKDLLDELS